MNPAQPYAGAHLRTGGTRAFSTHPQNVKKNGPRPNVQAPAPNLNLASALRVRNFRLLVQAIGDEDLAVALDLNMGRVKEIADGINYTDETAYHIETVLGLASGFMDKVNPKLDATDIERIKTLRHHAHAEEAVETTPAPVVNQAAAPVVQVVATSVASPSPAVATAPVSTETLKMSDNNNQNPSTDSANAEELALREVRRQNLAELTNRPKAKSHLARLTQMSPANISHRLHGNKIFDKATADYFCKVLGLPLDWFETPKEEAEIPEAVIQRLVSADSRPAEDVAPVLSRAPRLVQPAKKKSAPAPLAPVGQPTVSLSATALGIPQSQVASAPAASAPVVQQQREPVKAKRGPKKAPAAPAPTVMLSSVRAPATPVANQPVATVLQSVAQSAAPVASAPVSPSLPTAVSKPASTPAPAPTPVAAAKPSAPAVVTKETSVADQILLSSTAPVGPIAEALLRTLAQKSREGLLTETHALRILTDVVSL